MLDRVQCSLSFKKISLFDLFSQLSYSLTMAPYIPFHQDGVPVISSKP